jgi:hypothetical protein
MKHKKEKLIKIMNELVNFCFSIHMNDLNINFSCREDRGEISVEGYCTNPPMERLQDLEYILNSPRQEELEEYYWQLVGEGNEYQELEMIGALVDSGSIDYKDNILKISIGVDF